MNNRLRGVSRAQSLEIVLERCPGRFSAQEKEQLAAEKNDAYRQLLCQMSPADLATEVRTTLDALRGWGYRLAIGSSSKNAPFILERIGLGGYFDAVADGNHITYSKPHPEVFLCAAARLSTPPECCWVVEDAVAGVEAAKAAGMVAVAIGDAAKSGLAHHNIQCFGELAALLGPQSQP